MKYGYARVSTDGQSIDAQVRELKAAGARQVFREVASGAKTDRAQLRRVLARLDAGDVLIVTRLDRLARSTRDLLNTLAAIAAQGAGFRSLRDTWADTTTPHGRLMLTVLGGLAEFERELIRVRTSEGRSRAKARGVKLGRTPKLTPHQRREAIRRRANGETVRDIGRSYNVSHSTITRLPRCKKNRRNFAQEPVGARLRPSSVRRTFARHPLFSAPTKRTGPCTASLQSAPPLPS
jgi:DNA invertase Pin-like site-specific DNA recombinase